MDIQITISNTPRDICSLISPEDEKCASGKLCRNVHVNHGTESQATLPSQVQDVSVLSGECVLKLRIPFATHSINTGVVSKHLTTTLSFKMTSNK